MSEKPVHVQFADSVRRMRQVQGLSLQQLAYRARLSKSHVWDIEQGNSVNPTVATLFALAKALGCAPSELVSGFDEPNLHPLAMRVAVDVDRAFRIASGHFSHADILDESTHQT